MAAPELGGFRLLEPIAEGGLSTVWRARHPSGLPAAVKILRSSDGPEEAARFRDEIRAVAGLSHPGIVSILDLGHATTDLVLPGGQEVRAGAPWLAMEHVGGGTLGPDHLRSWDDFVAVAGRLLDALAHAHARGVIHRDLKPQNVLLADARRAAVGLKLTDFGIAWTRADASERRPTGTLTYMAPEQIEVQPRRYGPWTDLYGLGCLLWELATGAPPFREEPRRPLAMAHLVADPPPLEPRFEVPDALDAWLRRLLAKEAAERFPSAAEALRALVGREERPARSSLPPSSAPVSGPVHGAGLRLFGVREVPLVGRERERAELWSALGDAAEGPVLVAVRGPEGVGRSRLLRWLHERIEETGEASSTLLLGAGPGRDLTRALHARLGALGLDGEELREHLGWRVGHAPLAEDLRRELVDVLAPPRGRVVGRPDRTRVVARWLAEVARQTRVAWIVDDVRLAPDAWEVAVQLLADPSRPPVLVVVALADGQEPVDHARVLEGARPIPLGRLPAEDRLVLLRRWLAVEPELAARLDEETGGHPLLTIELLRDHVERGWLEPGPEGLRLVAGRGVVVPSDRLAPWSSRIDRIVADDEDARMQLELAAALGEDVPAEAWAAVGGEAFAEVRRALLEALVEVRLVERTAAAVRFAHPMVRAAVLRQARVSGRFKDAHRACLAWALRAAASPERVAGHLVALEDWEAAVGPLLDCAVARHHREGPAAGVEVLDQVDRALERAEVAAADPRRLRARALRAQLLEERGRPEEALALLDELDPALDADPGTRCRARRTRAEALADLAREDEAWTLHLRNAEDPHLPADLRVPTCDGLVSLAIRHGRLDEAARWVEEAERLHAAAGDEGSRGRSLVRRATVAALRGDLAEAHACLDRAEPLVARYGSPKDRADLANDRADLQRAEGRPDLAEPLLARAIELHRAAGYRAVIPSLNLAICKLEQRRVDEAEAVISESRATSLRPETFGATGASLILACCHAARSRWAAFDRALDRAAIGLATHTDEDFVRLLERAAAEADARGQVSRAARCRSLVGDQRARRS